MEKEIEREIGTGTSCFLVKDKSLLNGGESPIYTWLKEEEFVRWCKGKGGYSGVDWIYINIFSKVYAPGMPGIKVTPIVGNHAITFDEFKTIYEIFKKYDGLDRLRMNAAEQKEWEENLERTRIYWENMTFERYYSEVKNAFFSAYVSNSSGEYFEAAVAYFNEQLESIKGMFKEHCGPEYAAWQIYFTW